jgi:hypothetical protein
MYFHCATLAVLKNITVSYNSNNVKVYTFFAAANKFPLKGIVQRKLMWVKNSAICWMLVFGRGP